MPAGVKCFKKLFKHTWHVQQMDNPNFEEKSSARRTPPRCHAMETELEEVKTALPTTSVAVTTPVQSGGIPCAKGGCKASRSRGEPRPESPWHMLKTIFLITVIVSLFIWVVVYALLSSYEML